jgi:WD40 repeat protein
MAPSRFSQVSRFRNAVLSQSKAQDRYSELNLASSPDNASGKLIAISPVSSHIFARSASAPNSLLVLPSRATRKYGKQPPILHNASSGSLGDFDLCGFQGEEERILLACGSMQGDITIQQVQLPKHEDLTDQTTPIVLSQQYQSESLMRSEKSAINILHFHPTCQSLFFTSASDSIKIWDAGKASAVLEWKVESPQWDAKWSADGSQVVGSGKDTLVRLWDPRSSAMSSVSQSDAVS